MTSFIPKTTKAMVKKQRDATIQWRFEYENSSGSWAFRDKNKDPKKNAKFFRNKFIIFAIPYEDSKIKSGTNGSNYKRKFGICINDTIMNPGL